MMLTVKELCEAREAARGEIDEFKKTWRARPARLAINRLLCHLPDLAAAAHMQVEVVGYQLTLIMPYLSSAKVAHEPAD